jgi:NADPH:quinone reductase-like Zn-dependent oxidoreductase
MCCQCRNSTATELLIELDTAGVGPWDAAIWAAWYPGKKPKFSLVLGTDGAGVVVEVGSRVRRLKVGDKVYAYSWANSKGGVYAEPVAVAAHKPIFRGARSGASRRDRSSVLSINLTACGTCSASCC